MYSASGVYSCVGTELGAQPIATIVSSRYARGRKFDLDTYGGIMFTMSERDDINTVADLKDKIIGSQLISNFGGAQAQFYVMQQNGLDYIMDPKQVVFYGK
jgi:ABC-type amino acid transport substrate-binding protein